MYSNKISKILQIPEQHVKNVLNLFETGATIPFIARYRKEATGSLDELKLAQIQDLNQKAGELEKRRALIFESIQEQGKLTQELIDKIQRAQTLAELEDLYLPFKQKRKTRADLAKEKGLEPLAKIIMEQKEKNLNSIAATFINDQIQNEAEALLGASDIVAEWINEDLTIRNLVRNHFNKSAIIFSKVVKGKEEAGKMYRDYFQFQELLSKCPSHRLLAIRRGEEEGFLRVKMEPENSSCLTDIEKHLITSYGDCAKQLKRSIEDSYQRLLQPSIETEFRQSSKDKADVAAISVFVENLKQLLLAAPLGEKFVMGIDPGFRSGCKVVCLDNRGNLVSYQTMFPHPPQAEIQKSKELLEHLIQVHQIEAIAIGNGTAGRETMDFLQSIKLESRPEIYMVNEAGASIYSASEVAREEYPELDLTIRGAISIGRRLMDPLAELVKIDPKSIGVGQYQHDVNQKELKLSLDRCVSNCVNLVGINLNTASKHVLQYISGLGPIVAQNIIQYRDQIHSFSNRDQLKKVPRLGNKAFEQCAGFLRIRDSENPLDNTSVHPESYSLVTQMAKDLNCDINQLILDSELRKKIVIQNYVTDVIGIPTLNDILKELEKPGLDPRGEAKQFDFSDIRSINDLSEGMMLPGIITNITQFGAFVDLGIKDSGFIHISQLADRFVKDPLEVVRLNQQVMVKVLSVEIERKRIACTLKGI
ncbi:MAG: Tex family protein [Saprospiraceae bacterium]